MKGKFGIIRRILPFVLAVGVYPLGDQVYVPKNSSIYAIPCHSFLCHQQTKMGSFPCMPSWYPATLHQKATANKEISVFFEWFWFHCEMFILVLFVWMISWWNFFIRFRSHRGFSRWWQLNFFYFHPETWGRWTHFDEHIFQMGWNHQLAPFLCTWLKP